MSNYSLPTDESLSCGYKGVVGVGPMGARKYYAQFWLLGKPRRLGPFPDAQDAAQCFDTALHILAPFFPYERKPYRFNWPGDTSFHAAYTEKVMDFREHVQQKELGGNVLPEFKGRPKTEGEHRRNLRLEQIAATEKLAQGVTCMNHRLDQHEKKLDTLLMENESLRLKIELLNVQLSKLSNHCMADKQPMLQPIIA